VERRTLEFNISNTMPMQRLMEAYAQYFKLDLRNIYFKAQGIRIGNNDTAQFLGLRNGSVVEVRSNFYQYISNE